MAGSRATEAKLRQAMQRLLDAGHGGAAGSAAPRPVMADAYTAMQ